MIIRSFPRFCDHLSPPGLIATALAAVLAYPGFACASPLIALDIGHSASVPGAYSAYGKPEFEFNKALVEELQSQLTARGDSSKVIEEITEKPDLPWRTSQAKAAGAKFFLSVHHDSAVADYLEQWEWEGETRYYTDKFSGFSLYVSRKNPYLANSLRCASQIGAALRAQGFTPTLHHSRGIAGETRELADERNGVYYYDNLVVLKTANTPAVLLEGGVIVNRQDDLLLQQPATRQRVASAVVAGLTACRWQAHTP